jgi:uncharacterized protein
VPPVPSSADLQKAADQGDADAQARLGEMYFGGNAGLPQDSAKAMKWYKKAAAQGNIRAEYDMGWMYSLGSGMPKDFVQAVEWYKKGANQGDPRSQCRLGYIYDHGGDASVPQDYVQALEWYRLAADQGYPNALDSLGQMYERGEGVPQDSATAHELTREAARLRSAAHSTSDSK